MTNLSSDNPLDDRRKTSQRLGERLRFFGKHNCISCTYLLPIINYGNKHGWFDDVDVSLFASLKEYIDEVGPIVEKFGYEKDEFEAQTFAPVVIIEINRPGPMGLVVPQITQECANEIIEKLHALGDEATIDYMEGDLDLGVVFSSLLLKMGCNLLYES